MTAPLQIFQEFRVLVSVTPPSEATGWASVPNYETHRFRLDIRIDHLLSQLARTAVRSKDKRARMARGAIVVALCPTTTPHKHVGLGYCKICEHHGADCTGDK